MVAGGVTSPPSLPIVDNIHCCGKINTLAEPCQGIRADYDETFSGKIPADIHGRRSVAVGPPPPKITAKASAGSTKRSDVFSASKRTELKWRGSRIFTDVTDCYGLSDKRGVDPSRQ
jgi:hypothetical protein